MHDTWPISILSPHRGQRAYDKLDTTVRDEAERIARDMSRSLGVSDPNSYLDYIKQEVTNTRK